MKHFSDKNNQFSADFFPSDTRENPQSFTDSSYSLVYPLAFSFKVQEKKSETLTRLQNLREMNSR